MVGPRRVEGQPERCGAGAVEQACGAVAVHHDRWRMPGTGVHQLAGVWIQHRAEGRGAARTGKPGGEVVQRSQRGTRIRFLQKQCATSTSQLTHDGRRGQAVADAVADDQRDPPVIQIHDVVPVTADLKRTGGGLVAHREPARQLRRPEDRVLQRQRRFPLLVELMDPLQTLSQPPAEHREQRLVFSGERPPLDKLNVHHQHTPRVLQCDGRGARPCGVRDQQRAFPHRPDHLPGVRRQVGPAGRLTHPDDLGCNEIGNLAHPGGGKYAARLPQPAKFSGRRSDSVVERVGLRELFVE